jgi:hypothetical protein
MVWPNALTTTQPGAPLPSERLFEIQIGVYATEEDFTRLIDGCTQLMDGQALPYELSVAGETAAMPLAEFYDDLPQQWRYQHPDTDPGSRTIHQIQVGLLGSRPQMDAVRDQLTRVICPDPEHRSPCPVPWASSYTDSGPDEDDRLDRR